MVNIQTALTQARRYLKQRRIANFSQEAAWLLAHVLKVSPSRLALLSEKRLSPAQSRRLHRLLEKRGRHYPLQYLLGSQYFCGLEIQTPPGVLIPRPETEKLVEVARDYLESGSQTKRAPLSRRKSLGRSGKRPFIWDIGAGTGAIALALKQRFSQARIFGSDISPQAVRTARANARQLKLQVKFLTGDLLDPAKKAGLAGRLDLVVANPPYVTGREMKCLPKDVRFEPALALRGGRAGLDYYRRIIPQAKKYLRSGGGLVLEASPATWRGVRKILKQSGYQDIRLYRDEAGRPRVFSAIAPSTRLLPSLHPLSSPRKRGSMPRPIPTLAPGQTVVFPTDTVYGLGAAWRDQMAIKKIFRLKRRPSDKPLPILISDLSQLKDLGIKLSPLARKYIKKHWPGPVTLVLPTQKRLSPLISRRGTIAVRQPAHPLALALIKKNGPLAATSANMSSRKAPVLLKDIPASLRNSADYVIDGGACPHGRPSAIIDLTAGRPLTLR